MDDLKRVLEMFDNLGASYFCDYTDLKKAFRAEIKKHHPDVSGDSNRAKEIITSFRELQKIYNDKEKLEYYRNLFIMTREARNGIEAGDDVFQNASIFDKIRNFVKSKVLLVGLAGVLLNFVLIGDIIIGLLISVVMVLGIWAYRRL
ncbi:MAG: hypothetical protein RMJ37_03985 [Spirochaetia bacterium]|nr:hypothetical protein [Spirochaetota bacterium]MCX8096655.1 hypothetical protein [Spirochaetota bacterium]MDW8112486.1 hypothetical protein [Spirochaetia bacterium]